jgi:hypothetical protein
MIIALNDEILYNIADRIFKIGREQGRIDSGAGPKFISQNKADKLYGKGNVRKWVASGLVKKYKDADGKRNSRVRLDVLELETAAFKCNLVNDVSPMAKAEMRDIKEYPLQIKEHP